MNARILEYFFRHNNFNNIYISMNIGNHHVTIEDPIQDTSLCTQRGERKFEYENRLFLRLVNKIKPHTIFDGSL